MSTVGPDPPQPLSPAAYRQSLNHEPPNPCVRGGTGRACSCDLRVGFHVMVISKFPSVAARATNQFMVPLTLIPNLTSTSSGRAPLALSSTAFAASTAGPSASLPGQQSHPADIMPAGRRLDLKPDDGLVVQLVSHHWGRHQTHPSELHYDCAAAISGLSDKAMTDIDPAVPRPFPQEGLAGCPPKSHRRLHQEQDDMD